MSFSLYVHIPWCHSKCPYCDFNSYAASAWPEDAYVNALTRELTHRAQESPYKGDLVRTIFFGGGTPSLFRPESIGRVIETAHRLFGIEPNAEVTLEANPGTVDEAKLAGMRAAGVNRISFGAQSFNDATLAFLGRIHRAEDTRVAARLAHRAGFEHLNLDLIFAVPGQTMRDVMTDIGEAAALDPDHISAYNLTFEEGTAFFADLRRGAIRQTSSDEQANMYAAVREELPRRGYAMYEISNYARPGCESRHNLTYWRDETWLGIGAGAHSFAREASGGRRWWNERNPLRYLEQVSAAQTAEVGSERLDVAQAMGEFVFLNLRLRSGFALEDFRSRFGRTFDDVFGDRAQAMFEGGLLHAEAGRIRLTDRGIELADSVFAQFV